MNNQDKNNENRPYLITLCVLAGLIIILGVVDMTLVLRPMSGREVSDSSIGDESTANLNDGETLKPAADLTKEEALALLNTMLSGNYLPKNFVDSALTPEGYKRYFILEYSYDQLDDIYESDYHISDFGNYQIDINQIDDTYAVVVAEDNPERWIGVAFNKNSIDYYKETIQGDGYISTNDRIKINNVSDDFVKKALPILFLTTDAFGSNIQNIYDYEFKEQGDTISLVAYVISVGMDLENTQSVDDLKYALNIYANECYIDKSAGEFHWKIDEEGRKNNIIKSFSLTDDESSTLINKIQN